MAGKAVVVAVFDSAMQAFQRPWFAPHSGVACRIFADEVNRAADDNPLFKHPEDFELFRLCVFDEESGAFEDHSRVSLLRGKDARKSEG